MAKRPATAPPPPGSCYFFGYYNTQYGGTVQFACDIDGGKGLPVELMDFSVE